MVISTASGCCKVILWSHWRVAKPMWWLMKTFSIVGTLWLLLSFPPHLLVWRGKIGVGYKRSQMLIYSLIWISDQKIQNIHKFFFSRKEYWGRPNQPARRYSGFKGCISIILRFPLKVYHHKNSTKMVELMTTLTCEYPYYGGDSMITGYCWCKK